MALTAAGAFEEFKEKLLLTDTQKETVKSRQGKTMGYLAEAFPSSSDLPLKTTYLMGSASRDTIIRPLDDIDVLAIFTNKYDIFDRLYRYDSRKFLYRVRDALNEYQVEAKPFACSIKPRRMSTSHQSSSGPTAAMHFPTVPEVG